MHRTSVLQELSGVDGQPEAAGVPEGDVQGGLACCDSWGGKESDMTEPLN